MSQFKTNKDDVKKDKNNVGFAQVGGLEDHIRKLRRMIIIPLLYYDFYDQWKIKQPRGVLFYGPPGTGKTLVAQALAEECNKCQEDDINSQKVTFIHCNSGEIYDKWVGSSEKKIKSIFDQAARSRPAIIFFDEIDAMAPARTWKQDHVHTSVVATLLTLMNGLDTQPGIIVIGATNRIDSLDPALRRTGRFDAELEFKLPDNKARKDILEIQVKSWANKPSREMLEKIAQITSGYCGSDLQVLCEEAAINSLERKYPLVKKVNKRVSVDYNKIKVEEKDFIDAHKVVIPSNQRLGIFNQNVDKKISNKSKIYLSQIIEKINEHWPHFLKNGVRPGDLKKGAGRLLITGGPEFQINTEIIPGLLQYLRHMPVNMLNLNAMRDMGFRILDEGLAGVQIIRQSRKCVPSVLVATKLDEWWTLLDEGSTYTIRTELDELDEDVPILFIASATGLLTDDLNRYFRNNSKNSLVIRMGDLDKNMSDEKAKRILEKMMKIEDKLEGDKPNMDVTGIHKLKVHNVATDDKRKRRKDMDSFSKENAEWFTVKKQKGHTNLIKSNYSTRSKTFQTKNFARIKRK